MPLRNSLVLLSLLINMGGNDMHRKIAMAIMALSLGGCFILTSLPVSAQQDQQQQQNKGKGQSGGGGKAGAPGGSARTVTPNAARTVSPNVTRTVTTPTVSRKVTTPTVTRKVTAPTVTRKVTAPTVTRKVTAPTVTRKVTPSATRTVTPGTSPKVVTPSGDKAHVVTAGKLRGLPESGAGRTTILGHNYSVWRSGYRVRHGSGWRTFVALSALRAIAIGSINYYPYAYITAPQPYCTGFTEDGCQLMWQEVETIEGDLLYQCVAYCPWQ
jgi:hypothetical protein